MEISHYEAVAATAAYKTAVVMHSCDCGCLIHCVLNWALSYKIEIDLCISTSCSHTFCGMVCCCNDAVFCPQRMPTKFDNKLIICCCCSSNCIDTSF